MEIKLECACGQPFEFDVEPVDGVMPCEIKCPACQADATGLANDYIAGMLALQPVSPPVPPAAPEPPPAPFGLRINRPHAAPAPAPVAAAAPSRMAAVSAPAAPKRDKSEGDGFLKGVAGALIASLVGMMGWFLLIKASGYEIGYAAWGVGALTGLGARVVGAAGSTKLGLFAGLFAFIAIIGGQYLALRSIAETEFDKIAMVSYQEQLDTANAAVALTTAEDTKAFIAKEDEVYASEVSNDRLKEFRETELPKYRDLIAGKPSKAEFLGRMNIFKNSWRVQFEMLKASIGLFTLLWIFLGVGSAYKLGAGTND
ncbi:MAG TPA: hypothetical protein VK815_17615 [Candidatus Acidoferrales bacterium]|jgi:hypothetical protein|nr:hypothetical protein [Candidatus Acidoferrales bacterium]